MQPNESSQNQQDTTPVQQPQQPFAPNSSTPQPPPMPPAPKKNSQSIVHVLVALLIIAAFITFIIQMVLPIFVNRPITISDAAITTQAQKDLQPLLQNDLQTFYRTSLTIQSPKITGLRDVITELQKGSRCTLAVQDISKVRGGFDFGANKIYLNGAVYCLNERNARYTIHLVYIGDSRKSEQYSLSPFDTISLTSDSSAFLEYLDTRQPPTYTVAALVSASGDRTAYSFNSYQQYKEALSAGTLGAKCVETTGKTTVDIDLGLSAGSTIQYPAGQRPVYFTNGIASYDKFSTPDDYLVKISTEITCQSLT